MAELAKCKYCGAPVIWGQWSATGWNVALNPQPNPTGDVVLLMGGVVRYNIEEDRRLHRPRYERHSVTCTDAPKEERRRK